MESYDAINILLKDESLIFSTINDSATLEFEELEIIESLVNTKIEDIIYAIKVRELVEIKTNDVPIFSNFSDCTNNICEKLYSIDNKGINFPDLGIFLLGHDVKALAAYKYGETHAKAANLLGLANIIKVDGQNKVFLSKMGYYYLINKSEREKLITRLLLHTRIIQLLIKQARNTKYNAKNGINFLSETSQIRRLSNVKKFVLMMGRSEEYDFNDITNNIIFDYNKE